MEKKDNQKSENNFKSNHVHDDILPRSSLNLNKLILKFPEDKNQIPKIFPSKKEIFDRFNNFNTKDQNNFVNCSEIKNKNNDRNLSEKYKSSIFKISEDKNKSIAQFTDRKYVNNTLHQKGTISINQNTNKKTNKINSTITKNSHTYNEKEYIVSIIENYAREVGISAFNVKTYEIFTTQIIDNEAYINTGI